MSDVFEIDLENGATITDLDGVKRYFGLDPAEDPVALAQAVIEGTAYHTVVGIDPDSITLYANIGDGDVSTRKYQLVYPFTARDLTTVLNAIEDEAEEIWRQANLRSSEAEAEGEDGEMVRLPVSISLELHPDHEGMYALQIAFGPSGHQFTGYLEDLHRIVQQAHRQIHDRMRRMELKVVLDEITADDEEDPE